MECFHGAQYTENTPLPATHWLDDSLIARECQDVRVSIYPESTFSRPVGRHARVSAHMESGPKIYRTYTKLPLKWYITQLCSMFNFFVKMAFEVQNDNLCTFGK